MPKDRIEPGLKKKAERVFDKLGLSTTQAITYDLTREERNG